MQPIEQELLTLCRWNSSTKYYYLKLHNEFSRSHKSYTTDVFIFYHPYDIIYPVPVLSQLGPALGLFTICCLSTHNNTVQLLQRTIAPRTSYGRPCIYHSVIYDISLTNISNTQNWNISILNSVELFIYLL